MRSTVAIPDHVHIQARFARSRARLEIGWLLAPILALGLVARLLEIGRPFIGYHMWNEVYYVTIARDFEHFGPFFQYNYLPYNGSTLSPVFGPSPLVPWMIYVSSLAFGMAEWAARLPILVLGMVALLSLYVVARELYSIQTALLATFFAAIMPGAIFFSRQAALDGPMVAFGLVSLACLLRFQRTRRLPWLGASVVFLALSILAKYTGVLFVPSLLLVWAKMVRGDRNRERRIGWSSAAVYFVAASIPAFAWFLFGMWAASVYGTVGPSSGYLNRLSELRPEAFYWAAQVAWFRMEGQVGHGLWYFLVAAVALLAATRSVRAAIKNNPEITLLVVPWFAQILYPWSWSSNDAYTYPALYGVAIAAALLARGAIARLPLLLPGHPAMARSWVYSLVVLVLFSSLMDYKQTFRSSYHPDQVAFQQPVNAVTISDPFSSARLVRSVNVLHQPVLADLPNTLYYASDEYWRGKASWWWWGFPEGIDGQIAAIESREYAFVVFTLQPPVDVVDALARNNYRRIAPAAWQRDDGS